MQYDFFFGQVFVVDSLVMWKGVYSKLSLFTWTHTM